MVDGQLGSIWSQLHYATIKDTQLSQTCSEGYTFLLLYCTGVFLCFWGVLTRLDHLQVIFIIFTMITNSVVNNLGVGFLYRIRDELKATHSSIIQALFMAQELIQDSDLAYVYSKFRIRARCK